MLLAFTNAIELSKQQKEIDKLSDEISYLKRKSEIKDAQLTTNDKEEFHEVLNTHA